MIGIAGLATENLREKRSGTNSFVVLSDKNDHGARYRGDVGYKQQEFFLTGVTSAFTNLAELGRDGMWSVEPGETADYRTRVLIYLPEDMGLFSGSVFMEWLNVTTGFELPVSYGAVHNELLREGHVVVMVSAQYAAVEGGEPGSVRYGPVMTALPTRASPSHPSCSRTASSSTFTTSTVERRPIARRSPFLRWRRSRITSMSTTRTRHCSWA